MKRRGYTLRIGGRMWRITIPAHRVRFARHGRTWAAGWIIVRRLTQ